MAVNQPPSTFVEDEAALDAGVFEHAADVGVGQRNAERDEGLFQLVGIDRPAAVLVDRVEHVAYLLVVGRRLAAAFHQKDEFVEIDFTVS